MTPTALPFCKVAVVLRNFDLDSKDSHLVLRLLIQDAMTYIHIAYATVEKPSALSLRLVIIFSILMFRPTQH
ncbi:unnamed protein product [Albugo candida]|uniref:Uncharacterized protein n=1 Tax=Albugo candida TaxID=65357 RepID=A0A024G4R7_9STRA|nr:unnamed protein product [Albugo candida]|eukprot:CCI41756.1 unnamed protein product [Albugo candida]